MKREQERTKKRGEYRKGTLGDRKEEQGKEFSRR